MPTMYMHSWPITDDTVPLEDLTAEATVDLDTELLRLNPPMRRHSRLQFERNGDRLVAVVFVARAQKGTVCLPDFAEDVEWLHSQGVEPERIARQLGITFEAMLKRLRRAGSDDLASELVEKKMRANLRLVGAAA